MKKYLFIFISLISINSFSLTEGEFEVIQDINSNVSDIEINVQLIHNDLNSYLFSDEYKNLIHQLSYFFETAEQYEQTIIGFADRFQSVQDNTLMTGEAVYESMSYLDEILSSQNSLFDFTQSILYYLSDNWQDISNGFVQNHTDLLSVRDSLHNLEMKQEGYLQGFCTSLEDTNDSLTRMIDLLENQGGGSNAELPKFSLFVNTLTQYGKEVDINSLPTASVDTDGKFYSDMIKLTKFVAETEGSINNACLSILTNVQVIATVLSEKVQEDEVDEAIEDYRKDADSTKQIADRLSQEDVKSFFGFANPVSHVHRGLQVQSAPQGELISEFFVTDKFYYSVNNDEFSIDPVEYKISDELQELIKYGRMIVQFIYWTLSFLVAFFIFKWSYKIMYTFFTALGS